MREVFSALPDDADDDADATMEFDVLAAEATNTPVPAASDTESPTDKAADSGTSPVVKLPQPAFPDAGDIDGSNNSRFIPRFQRQMYRTDI